MAFDERAQLRAGKIQGVCEKRFRQTNMIAAALYDVSNMENSPLSSDDLREAAGLRPRHALGGQFIGIDHHQRIA
jgi:hypothetical protein